MDIIDQLDDHINKLEYDVMLPALPQTLNDLAESVEQRPEIQNGISNAPVVIDADFGTPGDNDFSELVEAIDYLADDMIDNIGLLNNTITNGLIADQKHYKRQIQLLSNMERIMSAQWEREQKDRAFSVGRTMDTDPAMGSASGVGGENVYDSKNNGSGGLDFDLPGFGRDKDKDKRRNQKNRKGPKGNWFKRLGASAGRNKGKIGAAIAGIAVLSEMTGFSNVTGLFEDKVQEPEPAEIDADVEYTSGESNLPESDIATSQVNANAKPIEMEPSFGMNALTLGGVGAGALAYNQRDKIKDSGKQFTQKVMDKRRLFTDSTENINAKKNSRFSTLKTSFSGNKSSRMPVDMFDKTQDAFTEQKGKPSSPDKLPKLDTPDAKSKVAPTKKKIPKLGMLGAAMGAFDIYGTATNDNLNERDKTTGIADSVGTMGTYMIPGIGQAIGLADLATTGINMAFDTEIPSIGGLAGDAVSSIAGGAYDLYDWATSPSEGDAIESTKESKSFFDNMTMLSALGPMGMIADQFGAGEAISNFFGFGDEESKEDSVKPKVKTETTATTSAKGEATTSPTGTAKSDRPKSVSVTQEGDTPYLKELAKAIPYYASTHNVENVNVSEVMGIYRDMSISQGMANAIAKDYLGEDFTAEIALQSYQSRMSAPSSSSTIETQSASTSSDKTSSDTTMSNVDTNMETSSTEKIVENSSETNSEAVTSNVDSPTVERRSEDVYRESYTDAAPTPEVIVNLDRAAEVKQENAERTLVSKPTLTPAQAKTKVINPPPSLGSIDDLQAAGGFNNINRSIG